MQYVQVYYWMLQQGDERLAPDEITFNSIINVLSKHGQVEKAQHVFDMMDMVRAGLTPHPSSPFWTVGFMLVVL